MRLRVRPYLTCLLLVANREPWRGCFREPHFGPSGGPVCFTVPDYDTTAWTSPLSSPGDPAMLLHLPGLLVTGDDVAVTVAVAGRAAPRLTPAQVAALRDALAAWLEAEAP